MICPSCAHENRPGAKFCEECAGPLRRVCTSCGSELRPTAKFCDECAAPVPGAAPAARPAAPADTRKVVTIVFADLVGSTALHERLEPESARRFMESYYVAMRGAVESHGGTVTQLLGDGVKAVFGIPRVAEDDAIRAVRAAAAMQDAFRSLAEQQRGAVGKTGLRVAVNTGEVVANDAAEIIGDPVNVAARLQEQGKDGDVVVGESTHRLVSTLVTLELLGSFALKGRSEAVKAYRVVSLERPAGAATAPFVGRADELARLSAVYATAVEKPAAALAVLLGSPGLGKSRLIDEFARRHADAATVVRAHCDAAGGATFSPLADALRGLLGIESGAGAQTLRATIESALPAEDADRTRIAGGVAALLGGSPASPEETFFVVRRMLGALAQAKPVVLVVDDLHWAEPLLLDLVEHLIQWGSGVPLFVLIGARPELRDLRSSLVTPGGLVADVVTLSGLDAGAAMRLAANVIGAADLPAAIAAKVLATSEGNPLFVGELVRMLVQEGALTKDGDRWTVGANLAALEMPPTIHALLAARIERLRPEDRAVLERAAVVGRHFSRSTVAALLPGQAGDLDARLESLRRSELIERDTGWLLGEPVLRFHHVLIRDAAYRRLLKGTRAELHAKLADWIEAQAGDAAEHDETIGWHLEQAHQFLRELGPVDENGARLGQRAATRLAAAGRRALARDDLPVAADLLGRAIERLDAGDPARADLALDWCEALLAAGDVGPAAAAIGELGRFSADSDRLKAWHVCFAGQHQVLTAPSELHATAGAVAGAAAALTSLGDAAGEAKAHFVHALALSRLGKVGDCEAALDRALAAARRAGDRRRANTVLAIAPLAALWGPSPVTRASGRCLDVVRVLRITQGAPAVEAVALSCQGVLEALRGRTEAARRMIASARRMVEELGITQRLLESDVFGGLALLLEGDAPAAERNLRGAYEGLRDLGLGIDAARAAALLARALLAQDRVEEAERLSHESETLAGDDLKAAIAWRGVRAEALARRGEHTEAIALAMRAVELAAATDALLDHADARLALAAALRAAGRGREADAEEGRAKELWQAKGATLLAERATRSTAPVAPPAAAVAPRSVHAARRRPVRPNFAFEEMRRAEAAVAARDARALEALYRPDIEIVDHQFGITYGHAAIVERVRAIIEESTDSAFAHEPLASLGDSLALCRMRSTATGSTAHGIPIGATEVPYLLLIEADEQGSARRIEILGDDKLGDAVVRLYERYAELLPDGPERARAAMAARSMAAVAGGYDDPEQRLAPVLAGDFVGVDHRHLSNWSLRGAAAYIEHLRALRQVADEIEFRQIDVVALGPYAQLLRVLHTGTARAGGGVYERPFLSLFATDADGHLARGEWFEVDREAEALARFDALADGAAPRAPVRRRVAANAATAIDDRFVAAVAARDLETARACFDPNFAEIDHSIGSQHGHDPAMAGLEYVFRSPDLVLENERLATLGSSLLLARRSYRGSSFSDAEFETGDWRHVQIALEEAGDQDRFVRAEVFAPDRLGDAIVRLYERHAEQLSEGAARTRARATARTVAVVAPGGFHRDGCFDLDAYVAVFRPDVEVVDHKLVGGGATRGTQAQVGLMAATTEIGEQVGSRCQDVLALAPDALLLRWLVSGVARESGGAFEWGFLRLFVFDPDGRVARYELFDDDREADALARFDALAGDAAPARRRVRANEAFAGIVRFETAFAAGDAGAWEAEFDASLSVIAHPTGASYGRDGHLRSLLRLAQSRDPVLHFEPIATLGERLVLAHRRVAASGAMSARYDVGAYEREEFVLSEAGSSGRAIAIEIFAADRLGDAIVRLYERWAAQLPEGAERARGEAVARAVAALNGPTDPDRLAATFAPDLKLVDHRLFGTWSARSAGELVAHWRAHLALSPDNAARFDEVLALDASRLARRTTYLGTGRESGGSFENHVLELLVFAADGRLARVEVFEPDQQAEMLARFDALVAGAPSARRRVRANAATESVERFVDALEARDADALPAFFDDALHVVHHPSGAGYGKREMLATWRSALRAERLEFRREALASLGTLVLNRQVTAVAGLRESHLADFGATEVDEISLVETDAGGRWIHVELFAPDRLGDAVVRLYERHAAQQSEDSERARATALAHAAIAVMGPIDLDRMAAAFTPDLRSTDHRVLGTWSAETGAELVAHFRHHLDLAPDFAPRIEDVLVLEPEALIARITYVGTARDSGGAFENRTCVLFLFGDDGRIAQVETFEAEQAAEALACFDAMTGRSPEVPAEPFANAASRLVARGTHQLWAARDWDGIVAMIAPAIRMDDRRRLVRLEIGYDEFMAQFRMVFDQPGSRWSTQLLATRGERLSLTRTRFEAEVADGGGPLAVDDHLSLAELDAEGRIVAFVTFDLEDEEAAYAELDARFDAEPDAAHGRVVGEFVRAIAGRDWDAVAALCSDAFVEHDHRRLAVLGTTHGAEAWMRNFRALVELAPDTVYRSTHVRAAARGFLSVGTWQGSREGGRYELPLVAVLAVDARGAIERADLYEPDQQELALARFRELEAALPVAEHFANAASRANQALASAVNARDWASVEAHAPSLVLDDRRRIVRLAAPLEATLRFLFDVPGFWLTTQLLATRGERLALHATTFGGRVAGGGGELESGAHLDLVEVDSGGRVVANLLFDPEDLELAYAELEARFEAGEGAAHPHALAAQVATNAAIRSRDWDALAALCAPKFRMRDHRLLGWGTMVNDAATFVSVIRSAVELAPDARYRDDHVRICARGNLAAMVLCGTRDGGAFENPLLRVTEVDAQGRILCHDTYDESDLERALLRFAELAAAPAAPEGRFENAASRGWRAVNTAWTTRDLDRFEVLHAAFRRYRDHRRLFQLDLDHADFLEFTRPLLAMRAGDASLDLVATRGERLALMHSVMRMEDEAVGPSTIESLMMIEVDARGAITAYDRWDLEDGDAAWAEIEARWTAGEGAQRLDLRVMREFGAALERRDWDAAAGCYAPDFVGHDHRLVGWGTVHGPTALVRALQEMVALAPDVRMRTNHQRAHGRGGIRDVTWIGTREGGAFESPFVTVTEHGADGRVVRADFYDPHHQGRAFARFEEIRATERRDGFAASVRPNLATAAMGRNWTLFDTLDLDAAQEALDAARSRFAPDFVWDDRRPLVGLSGGLDLMIASARERLASGARHQQRTIIGTAGDRVATARVLWAGGPEDGRFEVEFLVVAEVDEAGLFTAHVFFEPDDARAAQREAWTRWAAIEPGVAHQLARLGELTDAWNARDRARLRACFGEGLVVEDHRLAGIGRIEGADAHVDASVVLWELAPDQRISFGWSLPAIDRHGCVAILRREGTLPDGGAFESEYVTLTCDRPDGLGTHVEFFELDALDAALARFEALRPDPLRTPETTATRLRDRHRDAFIARDWNAMRALTGAGFVYEDRGKLALVYGDVEAWIASMQFTTQPGFRADTALIGTLGDRVVLDQVRWFGKPGGDAFEFERVRLLEVGEDGLLRAVLFFDPEDRSAASVEGLARFAAGEATGSAGATPLTALSRALLDRDWEAVRECFAPDLVVVDHRPVSLGTLDREPWIASLQAVDELGDGVVWEVFRVLACNEQGFVKGVRRLGTIAGGGGPFENEVYAAALVANGRIQRYEVFGEADAERAVARFAELCAEGGA